MRDTLTTAADDAMLRAIYAYQFLTTEQVTRLLYSRGSLWNVGARLKRLAEAGYLHRRRVPTINTGNTPFVYSLGRFGMRYLREAGISEFPRFRPSERLELGFYALRHNLLLNDVLIAAALLAEEVPELVLAEMRHDWRLKRSPVRVQLAEGLQRDVVPDAWLDYHIRQTARMSICLELDRGTEEEKQWKRKLRALLAFASGPYQSSYNTESLTIAFATDAGEYRLSKMKTWTEQVLAQEQASADAELFLFTALSQGELNPQSLFLGQVWQQPFGTKPVALLSLA